MIKLKIKNKFSKESRVGLKEESEARNSLRTSQAAVTLKKRKKRAKNNLKIMCGTSKTFKESTLSSLNTLIFQTMSFGLQI